MSTAASRPPPRPDPASASGPQPRWFFALRPPHAERRRLAALASSLAAERGGRPLVADDLHLTLAFVGPRPLADEAPLADVLDALARSGAPIEPIAVPRLGSFDGRLLWAGPEQTPAWLVALVDTLRALLLAASLPFDARPYRAHLTLVRGAKRLTAGDLQALQRAFGEAPRVAGLPIAEGVADLAASTSPPGWQLALGRSIDTIPGRRYRWRLPGSHQRVTEPS